ncbi:MAG: N-acylneuraminate-9-phosphate synthase [Acidimicrobiia bacterium]|nr:MAG: N-acylneuraminate-9-phosphate synthase [Acidimicrobiia bacterium]
MHVRIGSREVGPGRPCYVIAEAGANHDRDLDVARRLIDVAAEAGADAVKFQTYSGRTLYSTKTPRFDYLGELGAKPPHELLDEIALPRDWQPLLAAHCRDAGIEFLSSPFDRRAVDELDALDVAAFKIASFELVDLPLIGYAAAKRRPVILSTGMATLGEVEEAVETARAAGADGICLLQCASLYPAPPEVMNLRAIATMRAAFGVPVGLSDHTLGTHIAPAAVAIGADLVEKHFTLDRTRVGPDHPFAVEPAELKELVARIRDVEAALGDGRKRGPSEAEMAEMYGKARRSVVAACAIPAGTPITREMLTVKRPGFGIKPKFIDALVGRRARVDIDEDEVVTWEMV